MDDAPLGTLKKYFSCCMYSILKPCPEMIKSSMDCKHSTELENLNMGFVLFFMGAELLVFIFILFKLLRLLSSSETCEGFHGA